MTNRSGTYYYESYQSITASYTNNRHDGWSYDADGRILATPASTNEDARSVSYDAAGRLTSTVDTVTSNTYTTYTPAYDGDGRLVYEWTQNVNNGYASTPTVSYIVRSTVLGGEILTRLDQSGNKSVTYVPAEGLLFAQQTTSGGPSVSWIQRNPLGITENGTAVYDPLGNYVPYQWYPPHPTSPYGFGAPNGGIAGSMTNPDSYQMGCMMDGLPTSCNRVLNAINIGLAKGLIAGGTGNPNVGLLNNGIVVTQSDQFDEKEPIPYSTSIWVVLPQKTAPLPNLINGIKTLLSNSDCANFVQNLINQVAKDTQNPFIADYVPDLLDNIDFVFAQQYDSKGNTVAGKAYPRDSNGRGKAGISPIEEPNGITPFGRALSQFEYIESALHEVIHLAGSNGLYNDRQLAQAAVNLGNLPKGALEYFKTIAPNDVGRNSGFFDSILQNHCTGPNGKPTFK